VTLHGLEQPLSPGDERGLVGGEVLELHGEVPTGMHLRTPSAGDKGEMYLRGKVPLDCVVGDLVMARVVEGAQMTSHPVVLGKGAN